MKAHNPASSAPITKPCYVHLGQWHPYYDLAIICSQKAWDQACKECLGFVPPVVFNDFSMSGARCHGWKDYGTIFLVLDPDRILKSDATVLSCIIHESAHIPQIICRFVGDTAISDEAGATMVEWVAGHCIDHIKQHPGIKRKMRKEIS